MLDHPLIRHHKRFYAAAAVAFLAWWPLGALPGVLRLVVTGDVFFLVYLLLILQLTLGTGPERLRERAKTEDEGMVLISALTVAAIAFSLVSIFTLLNSAHGDDGIGLALALASVPLGWISLHTMAAQHYGNLYYAAEAGEDGKPGDRGGLDFPGDGDPEAWDFLYFSFVIGMTAQTSDVEISHKRMRRAALAHSIASFFFNTVLVAVAVNAALASGH
jgi:uncharacterized membrane protein